MSAHFSTDLNVQSQFCAKVFANLQKHSSVQGGPKQRQMLSFQDISTNKNQRVFIFQIGLKRHLLHPSFWKERFNLGSLSFWLCLLQCVGEKNYNVIKLFKFKYCIYATLSTFFQLVFYSVYRLHPIFSVLFLFCLIRLYYQKFIRKTLLLLYFKFHLPIKLKKCQVFYLKLCHIRPINQIKFYKLWQYQMKLVKAGQSHFLE